MIRCKTCHKFAKIHSVVVNGLDELIKTVGSCKHCGYENQDNRVDYDDWEKDVRGQLLDRIDFLSDHWVKGDDKPPFSFGGWRDEVADGLIDIVRQQKELSCREGIEACIHHIPDYLVTNHSYEPGPYGIGISIDMGVLVKENLRSKLLPKDE